jgi:hypothetical protein
MSSFALLSSFRTFRTADNNKKHLCLQVKCPYSCTILTKFWASPQIFVKRFNIKLHENPSCRSRADKCCQATRQTRRNKEGLLMMYRKVSKNDGRLQGSYDIPTLPNLSILFCNVLISQLLVSTDCETLSLNRTTSCLAMPQNSSFNFVLPLCCLKYYRNITRNST